VIFKRKKWDRSRFRGNVARLLHDLKVLRGRVSYLLGKVEARIAYLEDIFKYEDRPWVKETRERELRSLKALRERMAHISAILEVLVVRFETISLLSVTARDLLIAKEVLKVLKESSGIMPELPIIIGDVEDRVNDLLGYFPKSNELNIVAKSDASKILEEAKMIAEERLKSESLTA
jgi:hypothetical protein